MFKSKPIVEWNRPGWFIVRAPLIWAPSTSVAHGEIIVPDGFHTDLASVPRFLRDRKSFDPNGPSFPGAILHDWLYATGVGGKLFADEVFRVALLDTGMNSAAAWAHFKGVDWFGFKAYGDHARKRAAAAARGLPYPLLTPLQRTCGQHGRGDKN